MFLLFILFPHTPDYHLLLYVRGVKRYSQVTRGRVPIGKFLHPLYLSFSKHTQQAFVQTHILIKENVPVKSKYLQLT